MLNQTHMTEAGPGKHRSGISIRNSPKMSESGAGQSSSQIIQFNTDHSKLSRLQKKVTLQKMALQADDAAFLDGAKELTHLKQMT